jgi:hypothetical protein
MVFAIPSYTQATCFDRGKTEPDGFAQGGSVDVRDSILIANSPVREIQPLTGHISIGIRGIVSRQPVTDSNFLSTRSGRGGQLTRPEQRSVLRGPMRSLSWPHGRWQQASREYGRGSGSYVQMRPWHGLCLG